MAGVTTFDGDQEEWVEYAERLDNYFMDQLNYTDQWYHGTIELCAR